MYTPPLAPPAQSPCTTRALGALPAAAAAASDRPAAVRASRCLAAPALIRMRYTLLYYYATMLLYYSVTLRFGDSGVGSPGGGPSQLLLGGAGANMDEAHITILLY